MKRNIITSLVVLIPALILSACTAPKKVNIEPIVDPGVTQEVIPLVKSTTTVELEKQRADAKAQTEKAKEALPCEDDQNCFLAKFKNCQVDEFKLSASDGEAETQLSVIGLAGERCYFQGGLYSKAVLFNGGFSCSYPKDIMSEDVFNHFFGLNKKTDQESVKVEQDKLEKLYCRKI